MPPWSCISRILPSPCTVDKTARSVFCSALPHAGRIFLFRCPLNRGRLFERAPLPGAIPKLTRAKVFARHGSLATPGMKTRETVVIVGAGLAGLSAAVHLQSKGITPLVVEAQSNPGGRVCTVPLPSSGADIEPSCKNVELGATYFHGTCGNAAYDLALSSGLQIPEREAVYIGGDYGNSLFSKDGKLISRDGVVSTMEGAKAGEIAGRYAKALAELENPDVGTCIAPDASLFSYISQHSDYETLEPAERAVFRARDMFQCSVEGCNESTSSSSASAMCEYKELSGPHVQVSGEAGMFSIVQTLISRLPHEHCVRFNTEATSVCYEQGSVTIRLADESTIFAACVIWTPSLNVTKAACNDGLFRPPLPASRVAALNNRLQGIVERVYAVLETPLRNVDSGHVLPVYWESGDDGTASRDGSLRDSRSALSRHDDKSSPYPEWCRGIYLIQYDVQHLYLDFWLNGRYGTMMSEREETVLRSDLSALLSVLYEQTVSVRAVVRSSWGENPFTRGSYSCGRVGTPHKVISQIGKPLPSQEQPLLCFAGEATHELYYGTMHAAIESGIREAQRCVEYLANQ